MKALSLALLLSTCTAMPMLAQSPQCGERQMVMNVLAERYGETLRYAALNTQGTLIEFYGNETTGSWTLLTSTTPEFVCQLAAGDWFESFPHEAVPNL